MKRLSLIIALAAAVVAAPAAAQLFVGTSLNPIGTSHNVFEIDVATDMATSVLDLVPVWGATYDPATDRVLFTTDADSAPVIEGLGEAAAPYVEGSVGGSPMLAYDPNTGTTSFVGNIVDGAGAQFRMDGLAISNGVLYGSLADALNNGIYEIDMGTFTATQIIVTADSISGIDADPDTGTIYGVNDTTGQVVVIDPGGGTINNFAAYPGGESDIDGIAVGGGKAYLVTDEPGSLHVLDLATQTYDPALTAPWAAADTFSGGALIAPPVQVNPLEIPTVNGVGLALLAMLLFTVSVFLMRRRRV